jgi:hypothetical protein
MGRCQTLALIIVGLSFAGCSSDPQAPTNQVFPIRQMDGFFGAISGQSVDPEYLPRPGYAPAYPPY